MTSITELEPSAMSERLISLLGAERQVKVDFLLHLAEFDRRHLYENHGYATLWAYCERELKLQSGAIFRRTTAARLLQRTPCIAGYLRDGRLCMTTLVQMKDVLNEENVIDLCERASWKSKDDVAILVASLDPKPAVRTLIRKQPAPAPVVPEESRTPETSSSAGPAAVAAASPGPAEAASLLAPVPKAARRSELTPLSAEMFLFRASVPSSFVEKLKRLADLYGHVILDGNPVAVLTRVMDEALARDEKRKRLRPAKPARKENPARTSVKGHRPAIPAEVARIVWARDGGRCAWMHPSGKRCDSTCRLQLDHIEPVALGGESTPGNVRLLCADHNRMYARERFGRAVMARYEKGGSPGGSVGELAIAYETLARASVRAPPTCIRDGPRHERHARQ